MEGVRLGQAPQEELTRPLRLGLGRRPPVGPHLLKLVVHIEPDPGEESSVSPALPPTPALLCPLPGEAR